MNNNQAGTGKSAGDSDLSIVFGLAMVVTLVGGLASVMFV